MIYALNLNPATEVNLFTVSEPAQMNQTFAEAFNSRDLGNLVGLYEDDGVLLIDGSGESFRGKEEISRALQKLLAVGGTMTSRNNFCIQHGHIALLRADFMILGTDDEVVARGSTAEVIRRQSDGTWLYVVDHAAGGSLSRVE